MTSKIKLPFSLRVGKREYFIGDEVDAADLTDKQIALVNRVVSLSNAHPVVPVLAPALPELAKVAAPSPAVLEKKKPGFFKSLFGK
jgi:hypothetical protein